jgi:hypothetical protein
MLIATTPTASCLETMPHAVHKSSMITNWMFRFKKSIILTGALKQK